MHDLIPRGPVNLPNNVMWAVKLNWMTSLKWRVKIVNYIAVLGFTTVISYFAREEQTAVDIYTLHFYPVLTVNNYIHAYI